MGRRRISAVGLAAAVMAACSTVSHDGAAPPWDDLDVLLV
jgi:hypothetical protein